MQLYFHGESIPIKVKINNESNKSVKNIKISGGFPSLNVSITHWCHDQINIVRH